MLTPSFKTNPTYCFFRFGTGAFTGGALDEGFAEFFLEVNEGGASNVHGNPGEAIQRARVASSNPVKPKSDRRTRSSSVGEAKVTSVIVLPSFGPIAASHFCSRALVGARLR